MKIKINNKEVEIDIWSSIKIVIVSQITIWGFLIGLFVIIEILIGIISSI